MDETFCLAKLFNEGDSRLRPFLPNLIEAFPVPDGWVLVHEKLDGWYTLRQVRAVYPTGVDPKDFAWMFRRALAVLGFVAGCHVEHRAIGLDTMLIHPEQHGFKLVGWGDAIIPADETDYSSDADRCAIVCTFIEVLGGSAKTLVYPDSTPREIRTFLQACLTPDLKTPAHELLRKFDELLERIWGRRRFHPFTMNPSA